MVRSVSCSAALLVALAALAAALPQRPAMAQNQTNPAVTTSPGPSDTTPAANGPSAPAAGGTPQLQVATVKLSGGWRASKFIGSAVFDDQNHQIGKVDDLVLDADQKASVAILSVGGFLGIGNKLVAVKFDQLHYDPSAKDAKVVMSGASKDSLSTMPNFTYGND